MKSFCLILIIGICIIQIKAQDYFIDASSKPEELRSGHLKLGGTNMNGEKIEVNNFFMKINEKPVIPITGEFHYSRYPIKYWDESIKKMKAGGIDVVATYVFWIMHEEKEGVFDWSGNKNLRQFVQVCGKNNMKVIVRIGPFCHGEIRNGGLPDWLLGKPLTIRSNDPVYLGYVERFYNAIGQQLKGLLFKDGGPVFAIQIENEYQHSASPWGLTYPGQPYDWTAAEQDRSATQAGVGVANDNNPYASLGSEHMKILKSLAIKAELDVPVYTATGWGYAAIIENESLPVSSAYTYPTWAPRSLSKFYLYKDIHKIPDYSPVRYKPEDYPNFTAEIGGGIMITYGRRPTVPASSLDAIINRFLGSGANGIGYYMYHGGSTPKGENFFFSDEAYAYPKISYDFQAPIGEFGQIRPSFNKLKVLHYFITTYANELAPMETKLPENAYTLTPTNTNDLRYCVRSNGMSGFVFMNNFQDHLKTVDIKGIQLHVKTEEGTLAIPESGSFVLKNEENTIFPFNLNLEGIRVNYATAQPLLKLKLKGQDYFVFLKPTGIESEFSIKKEKGLSISSDNMKIEQNDGRYLVKLAVNVEVGTIDIKNGSAPASHILIITRNMAEKSWLVTLNGEKYLMLSDALVLQNNNMLELYEKGNNNIEFEVYPSVAQLPKTNYGKIETIKSEYKIFSEFRVVLPEVKVDAVITKVSENKLSVEIPQVKQGINDFFLNVDYKGDNTMAFINGELVADDFYYGQPWQIGLKKFMDNPTNKEMVFYFRPLYEKAPFYEDFESGQIPDFTTSKTYLKINDIKIVPEYKAVISF